jgi:hypothetical protein
MAATYVSFLVQSPTDPIEPNQRIEWLKALLSLNLEMVLCVDSFYFPLIPAPFPSKLRILVIDQKDFETYKLIHSEQRSLTLPPYRNEKKDTLNYLTIQNLKPELLYIVRKNLGIYTPYMAYLDAGIAKIFKKPAQTLETLEAFQFQNIPFLLLPGCHPMPSTPPSLQTLANSINWTFCGGFFVVPTLQVSTFFELHKAALSNFLANSTIAWEVNVWTAYLPTTPGVVWYSADHNDTMITAVPAAQQKIG